METQGYIEWSDVRKKKRGMNTSEEAKQLTFDSVSTLTSNVTFLYLYNAAISPVDSPPFFTAVEVRTYKSKDNNESI